MGCRGGRYRDAMTSDVHVHLELGHVSLEFQGSQSFFDRCIDPLVRAACGTGTPGSQDAGSPAQVEAEVDPVAEPEGFRPSSSHFGSFLQQVGSRAETPEQQVMAFAFFLWNYERTERFGTDEIAGCFRAVGLEPPEDLDARIDALREKQRFLEAVETDEGERSALTTKGRNYVKNRLLGSE